MLSRYTSNDWIKPIIEEAKPVFEEFPVQIATEIATAVLKHADSGQTDIPWVTVFPSDDKSQIMPRLVEVLQTPDYSTPAYNPDTHLAFEELIQLLDKHEAVGMLGAHAAYYFVQAAAGKENELFCTYQDISRRYPQYGSSWRRDLSEQFGKQGYGEIVSADYKLLAFLLSTEGIAEDYYENDGSIAQPGESAAELISRTFEFFDISVEDADVDIIVNATKILERGLEGYRALAYEIRGLPVAN